jgi:hypothetical protein
LDALHKATWVRTDNQIQNMTMAAMLSAAIKVHALIVGWSERFRSSQRRRVEAMLRRLNSELRHGHKGFSVLVPRRPEGRPMAITLVYGKEDCVSTPALFETVSLAMRAPSGPRDSGPCRNIRAWIIWEADSAIHCATGSRA